MIRLMGFSVRDVRGGRVSLSTRVSTRAKKQGYEVVVGIPLAVSVFLC